MPEAARPLIFLCLCLLAITGTAQTAHKETSESFYANGQVKMRIESHYDNQGVLYKSVYERFRRNGNRRYVSVMAFNAQQTYYARYNRDNRLRVEKYYYYNAQGTLIAMEVKRDGQVRSENYATDLQGRPLE